MASQFGKMMESKLLSKMIQLSIVFHILSNGRPITDYPTMTKYLSFIQVQNFPSSRWSLSSGWEWGKYIAQVEKDHMKEKIAKGKFYHYLWMKLQLLIILHGFA